MIISHQFRFIFIKTHKTAGSSMEMALGRLCGPDDIISSMETNLDSGIPRNYHEPTLLGRCYANSRLLRKCMHRHSRWLGAWYYEHMAATRIRQLIGETIWNSYYKFCFERNPWEKVVSYYHWKKFGQQKAVPSFEDFVLKKTHRLPQDGQLYLDGTTLLVDEVFDFRDFQRTFKDICWKLDIPFDGEMPEEKTGIARTRPDYRTFYNSETQQKVAEVFRREVGLMGYTFDGKATKSARSPSAASQSATGNCSAHCTTAAGHCKSS